MSTLVWLSQCFDTSKHSKAILKYCIMQCMWGLSLQNSIHLSSYTSHRNRDKSSEDGMWQSFFHFHFRMVTYTVLSHDGVWNVYNFQRITAFTWWPPGEHYNNNNMDPCTLWFQYKLPSLKLLYHFMEDIIITFVTNYSKPDKQTLLNFKQETVLLLFFCCYFCF